MTSSEYWKSRFGKEPKSDKDKFICAFASDYADMQQNHRDLDMEKLLFNIQISAKEIIDMQTGLKNEVVSLSDIIEHFKSFGIEIEMPF